MNECNRIDYFHDLLNNYILHIFDLMDHSIQLKLVSSHIMLFAPQFKKYIQNNKIEILQNCMNHIDDFRDFSFDDFNDMDDNQSFDKYMPKIKKTNIKSTHDSDELFNFLLEIKNKSKKLNKKSHKLIKLKITNIIQILDNITNIFI